MANPVPVEWYDSQAQVAAISAPSIAARQYNQCRKGRRKTGDTDVGVFRTGNGRVLFAAEGWQAGRSLMAAFEGCC